MAHVEDYSSTRLSSPRVYAGCSTGSCRPFSTASCLNVPPMRQVLPRRGEVEDEGCFRAGSLGVNIEAGKICVAKPSVLSYAKDRSWELLTACFTERLIVRVCIFEKVQTAQSYLPLYSVALAARQANS